MATWKYEEEYDYSGFYGDEHYTLKVCWNTTSDSGGILNDEGDIVWRFGEKEMTALENLFTKIREDHGMKREEE